MTMISLPLFPFLFAVFAIYSAMFGLIKLYDEEWTYALIGTVCTAALSFLVYWIAYGMEAYF